MDSNTHSTGQPDGLAALAGDGRRAGQRGPRRADRRRPGRAGPGRCGGWSTGWKATGCTRWPRSTAAGPPGPTQGVQAASTAGWLRSRLRMGATPPSSCVRTARALFRGPLTATAQALTDGEISPAHAAVLAARHPAPARPHHPRGRTGAAGRGPTPGPTPAAAGPGPPAGGRRPRRRRRTGLSGAMNGGACGCRPPWRGWSRSTGCWRPRPARPCWRPWSRWPARPTPRMGAAAANARPTPSLSWPAATWRAASCPRPVGSGPS